LSSAARSGIAGIRLAMICCSDGSSAAVKLDTPVASERSSNSRSRLSTWSSRRNVDGFGDPIYVMRGCASAR
jgi:hypothetical protein